MSKIVISGIGPSIYLLRFVIEAIFNKKYFSITFGWTLKKKKKIGTHILKLYSWTAAPEAYPKRADRCTRYSRHRYQNTSARLFGKCFVASSELSYLTTTKHTNFELDSS